MLLRDFLLSCLPILSSLMPSAQARRENSAPSLPVTLLLTPTREDRTVSSQRGQRALVTSVRFQSSRNTPLNQAVGVTWVMSTWSAGRSRLCSAARKGDLRASGVKGFEIQPDATLCWGPQLSIPAALLPAGSAPPVNSVVPLGLTWLPYIRAGCWAS